MATSPASGGGRPQAKGSRVIPFGKYLLLERLAVGGMAEVFLSKSFGIEGFEKIIAIKRILPTMAEDEDFIEMFIDEAKIAGQLNHANVVPIYELGKIGDSHYIAMEYVWGKDLLQIMNRFRRMRKRMPPAMVAFVASRMCEALEYAHTKRDRAGTPLNLIHRDISPQNILVSYEGAVKLIDFGIAKAASRTTKTQAGVLKGKFGYMSPEQVRGLPIDHRSDIFAVGTCMYEMLTADRLFLGESDFSTLEKVRHATVSPLSEMVPGIPEQLEKVIMKALSREPADRWQSAGELQESLQEFLATERPPFTTSKLASWMKAAFSKEMAAEKSKLDGFAHVGRPSVLGAPPAPVPKPTPQAREAKRTIMGMGPLAGLPNPGASPTPAKEPSIAELDPSDLIEADDADIEDLDDDVGDMVSDATMVTASPFDEMDDAGGFDDLEEEATSIFFSADASGELVAPAEPPRGGMPSGSVQVFSAPIPDPVQGEATVAAPIESFSGGAVPKPAVGGVSLGSGQAPAHMTGFDDDRPTLMLQEEAILPGQSTPQSGLQVQSGAPVGFAAPPPTAPGQQRHLQTMEMGSLQPDKRERIKKIAMIAGAAVLLIAVGVGAAFAIIGGGSGTGSIEVRTVPDVNAEVRIDDVGRGHAPVRISEVPTGTRVVQVVAEGYETITRNVDVGEDSTAALELVLVASARPTQVAANTQVQTAMLPTVMDTVTPTMVEAEMDAETVESEMDTESGMDTPTATTMEAETSAMVSAMTPTTMQTVARMTNDSEQMVIRRDEDPPGFMVIMRAEPMTMARRGGRGRLVVNSQPWSKVFVDGRERGNTPQPSLTVPAGEHRIELRTQDGRVHRRTVEVENGGTVRVIHRF